MVEPEALGDVELSPIASSLRWSAAAEIVVRVTAIARGLVLARLLGPAVFGVFFGLTAFTNIVVLAAELGLGAFVIHSSDNDKTRAAAAASVATGALGFAVVLFAAPLFQGRYGSRAVEVLVVLGAVGALLPLSRLAQAVLRSSFRFRALGAFRIGGELVATALAVGLCVLGNRRDVWPLVAVFAVSELVLASGALFLARPRPSLRRLRVHGRALLSFCVPLGLSSIVWLTALQGDNLIVGKELGVSALGFYGVGYNYGSLPATLLGSVVGQVAFPVLSRSRTNLRDVGFEFERYARLIAVLVVPVIAAAVVVADVVVEVALGDKWQGAVTPLRIFLISGAVRSLFPTDELFRALGRVRVELRLGMAAAPAVLVGAYIGTQRSLFLTSLLVGAVFCITTVVGTAIAAKQVSTSAVRAWLAPAILALLCFPAAVLARVSVEGFGVRSGFAIAPIAMGASIVPVLALRRAPFVAAGLQLLRNRR